MSAQVKGEGFDPITGGERVIPKATQVRIDAVREALAVLLAECTARQREQLNKIHDGAPWKGLANLPDHKVDETYELVRRTVIKNEEKVTAATESAAISHVDCGECPRTSTRLRSRTLPQSHRERSMTDIEKTIGIVMLLLCAFLMLRLIVSTIAQARRIKEVHARNMARIHAGGFFEREPHDLSFTSYLARWLDIRKWTYRQFYPEDLVP